MQFIKLSFWSLIIPILIYMSVATYSYQIQKILPHDISPEVRFGADVAVDGNKCIIAADNDHTNGDYAGSAYIYSYNLSNDLWINTTKLIPSEVEIMDLFGTSVDLHGDLAIIGAPGDDDAGSSVGAAYIFRFNHSLSEWRQEQKLIAPEGQVNDYFGYSVGINNHVAVIGDYRYNNSQGVVYIFSSSHHDQSHDNISNSWIQTTKIVPFDGQKWDYFGFSLSLDDNNIIIAADGDDNINGEDAGSAYIYNFNGSSWNYKTKLLPANGSSDDRFGGRYGVDISGRWALIAAYADNDRGLYAGACYFYYLNDTNDQWQEHQKIYGNDTTAGDYFGWSVSIDGDTAIIGAVTHYANAFDSGSSYIFRFKQDNELWVQTAKIVPDEIAGGDEFGNSVSIKENNIIIGAYFNDEATIGADTGVAYAMKNYDDCNDITSPLLYELYLIQWEWTVCFMESPSNAPSIATSISQISDSPTSATTSPKPTSPTAIILILAMVCGIVGLIAFIIMIYFVARWCRQKTISNPLVVLIAIGKYDNYNVNNEEIEEFEDLDVGNDVKLFDPLLKQLNYNVMGSVYDKYFNEMKEEETTKVHWTAAEIMTLLTDSGRELQSNLNIYDSLIVIISSHGEEGHIITSDLQFIAKDAIHRVYSLQYPETRRVPRLFLFDCCEGDDGPERKSICQDKGKFIYISAEDIRHRASTLIWKQDQLNPDFKLIEVHASNIGFKAKMSSIRGSYLLQSFREQVEKNVFGKRCCGQQKNLGEIFNIIQKELHQNRKQQIKKIFNNGTEFLVLKKNEKTISGKQSKHNGDGDGENENVVEIQHIR